MNDIAISVKNLSKKYRLYDSPQHRLKEALHPFRKKYHRDFWALKEVSFEVKKGETFGIIGRNGAGKSTLLQIITGTLTPSAGTVDVNGRVSALLELGAGFNPEFTGRQNVYMNGALIGYTKEQIDERFRDITDFADIGDFIDQPVKTYSSGMYVRLAFSVAINVDPDILIVDEALSVGDMFFQTKCMMRIKDMIDNGVSLLFVSHSYGAVKSLCRNAILLDKGRVVENGDSSKVVERYFAMRVESEQTLHSPVVDSSPATGEIEEAFNVNSEFLKRAAFQRIQNGKANFVNVQLLDATYREIHSVEFNQPIILRMAIEVYEDLVELSHGYHIRDINGVDIVYSGAGIENKRLENPRKGDRYIVDWKFKTALMEGSYTITCVMSIPIDDELGQVDFCDFIPIAVQFQMMPRKPIRLYGLVHWDNQLDLHKIDKP